MSEEPVDYGVGPDPVETPVRGTRKTCLACGEAKLGFTFTRGSDVCKVCEGLGVEAPPGLGAPASAATGTLAVGAALEDDPQPWWGLEGSAAACDWLQDVCGRPGGPAVTLDTVRDYLRATLDERDALLAQPPRRPPLDYDTLRPDLVPVETAAQALYLWMVPEVRDALDAACEMHQKPLGHVMRSILAYHRHAFTEHDDAMVPVAPGRAMRALPQAHGVLARAQGHQLNEQGQFVRECECCARAFTPPKDKPNQAMCDNDCGNFADALRIWALHTSRVRADGTTDQVALPDPLRFWPEARWTDQAALTAARAYRDRRVPEVLEMARKHYRQYTGAA